MVSLLLVAPTVDGADIGEAWVAYQWAKGLSERHDVTLLTYTKRGARPASEQLPATRVVEWDEPPLIGRAERLNSLMKPAYMPFFARARHWVRAARKRGEVFDVAHQVVPVGMRYPTPVLGAGIPFVVGPVGGGLPSPRAFVAQEGTAPWYMNLRAVDRWRLRHDPLLRRTYEEAACVLAIAPYVSASLEGLHVRRLELMPETGVAHLPPVVERTRDPGEPLRLLHVGRLVRTKGARDVIAALAHLRDLDVVLDIVGDGPDRGACEDLAATLGVADRVTFHGRLLRADIDEFYRRADVFVFPSYREPGGNVQFEAMAFGLPLVVADVGGPAAAVDDSCALTVHPTNPEQYAFDVADRIRRLDDDELRGRMGAASRDRVGRIGLWEAKLDRVGQLYDEILRGPT